MRSDLFRIGPCLYARNFLFRDTWYVLFNFFIENVYLCGLCQVVYNYMGTMLAISHMLITHTNWTKIARPTYYFLYLLAKYGFSAICLQFFL